MPPKRYTREALARVQERDGDITVDSLAKGFGITAQSARNTLPKLVKSGLLVRVRYGQYRVPAAGEITNARWMRAIHGDAKEIIGVPEPAGVKGKEVDEALAALLIVGRKLSRLMDAAADGSSMQEWLAGALNEQSRQGAMLALVKGMCDA